jgi:uroporphyrinogen-III synthase
VPDVIVFPSSAAVNAASAYLHGVHRYERRPAVAAMGPASSAAAHAAGFTPDVVAPDAQVDALVGALRAHLGKGHGL